MPGQAEPRDKRSKTAHRIEAGAISPRRPLESVKLRQLPKGAIDLPEQHGSAGSGAAFARQLAIDDDDIQALAGQPLGHQRAGNAAADDQRVTFHALAEIERSRVLKCPGPRRATAAQIGLFGFFRIENADGSPQIDVR